MNAAGLGCIERAFATIRSACGRSEFVGPGRATAGARSASTAASRTAAHSGGSTATSTALGVATSASARRVAAKQVDASAGIRGERVVGAGISARVGPTVSYSRVDDVAFPQHGSVANHTGEST